MAWAAQVTLKRQVGHSNAMQVHKRRGRLTGSRTDVPSGYLEAGRACCVEATLHGGISPRESGTAPLEAVCSKLRPHQAKFPIRVKRRFTGRDASGRVGCAAFGAQVRSPSTSCPLLRGDTSPPESLSSLNHRCGKITHGDVSHGAPGFLWTRRQVPGRSRCSRVAGLACLCMYRALSWRDTSHPCSRFLVIPVQQ